MSRISKAKDFIKTITRRQWILLAYLPIHLTWFLITEQLVTDEYTVIYNSLDDLIPFCEWFIFPYLSWFLYMAVPGIYFLIKDPEAFEKYLLSLFIGFFFSMAIITFFHSGQDLRPIIDPQKNIASWIVNFVYNFDTNTNVLPSMHIVGTIAVAVGIAKSKSLRRKMWIQIFSALLALAICAGTVFLKQHSVLDVYTAVAVEIPILIFVYTGAAGRVYDRVLKENVPT